jgi:hypothetical protein
MTRNSARGMCPAHYSRSLRGELHADKPIGGYARDLATLSELGPKLKPGGSPASYAFKAERKLPPRELSELERRIRGAITTLTWGQIQ